MTASGSTQGFTIRVAGEHDYDAVRKLFEDSYPALLKGSYENDELEAALPSLTLPRWELLKSSTYYVAEATHDGSIIGAGGWTWEMPVKPTCVTSTILNDSNSINPIVQQPYTANLRHFATSTSWTRKSVGRAIFNRCHAECSKQGARYMIVYSTLNSIPFYTHLGFKFQSYINLPVSPYGFRASLLTRDI